ncbi:chromosome segregation and condensation protein ScpA [Methanohalobium evestigatum Z-7303]|uniref:Chromosome segregation and condensation protein ScpA n=1 Tax=Methanohalobium evestigatum (strain ATCC BAA-1072 / DSM 3721 / NBRC 107634 / OCM 161 / Z-7303) TaxID=644295 RepID=D7EAF4_METEZ|nr:chromosome segregation and condensation protein ScpA [Methanohalobium evestigatum Z-7303]
MVKNVETDQVSKNVYEIESGSFGENKNDTNHDPEYIKTFQMLGLDESQIELSDDVMNEPVEMLVNLANDGDIDPWDIDIVDITDKFLDKIEQMKLMDLRISARTLLYASVLLRMKSTGIIQEEEEDEDEEPDSLEMDGEIEFSEVEDYPVPNLPVRRNSKRPVTLNELVTELKKAEKVESRRKERNHSKKEIDRKEEKEQSSTDEVLDIAHEEDITGRAEGLYEKLEEMFQNKSYTSFSEISYGERSEKVMTYLSLLFLAADRKIKLNQEELFGELYIFPGNGVSEG